MKNSVKKIIIGGACSAIAIAALSVGGVSAYKKSAEKNSIGFDAAYSLAVEDAGISKENAQEIRNDFERENGKFVYEVEFDAEGKEYDYIIDAKSGEIIESESENEVPATSQTTASEETVAESTTAAAEESTTEVKEPETKQPESEATTGAPISDPTTEAVSTTKPADTSITLEKAKSIVLSDAGIKASNATFTKAKLDREDNCYDIEFVSGNKKYEYEVSAKSGRITDKEVESISVPATENKQSSSVTLEKAKSIALANAGLKASKVTFTKAKLDREDNCYDIEFVSGNKKYEYEVSVKSGKIISKETENVKPEPNTQGDKGVISVDEAKKIALKKANLKASDVRFIKAKLERDDGIQVYEIEFICGRYEYDVEINASNGNVLDYSREIDD